MNAKVCTVSASIHLASYKLQTTFVQIVLYELFRDKEINRCRSKFVLTESDGIMGISIEKWFHSNLIIINRTHIGLMTKIESI